MTSPSATAIILSPRKKSSPHRKGRPVDAKPHAELAFRMLLGLHKAEMRARRRINFSEVARRMGEIAPPAPQVSTVTRWFDGESSPDTREAMATLAQVFGVDPGWLAYGPTSQTPAADDAQGDAPGNTPRHAPMGEPFTFLGPTNKMPLDEARRALGLDEPAKRPKRGS